METVLSALAVYAILLVMTRISGRRTLSEVTVFDFVLVLLIADTAQSAMVGLDGSFTNAIVLIATLILTNVLLSLAKFRARWLELIIDGAPTILMRDGALLDSAMQRARVTMDDILQSARMQHGLSHLSQISWAVLETSGTISIIPVRSEEADGHS